MRNTKRNTRINCINHRATEAVLIFFVGYIMLVPLAEYGLLDIFDKWNVPGLPIVFVLFTAWYYLNTTFNKSLIGSALSCLFLWYFLSSPLNAAILLICVFLAYYIYLELVS